MQNIKAKTFKNCMLKFNPVYSPVKLIFFDFYELNIPVNQKVTIFKQ